MRLNNRLALLLLGSLAAAPVLAQDAARLHQRALAATCANCHGTDGRTAPGSAVPSLAGMPKEYIPIFMTFSARTSANQTQDQIDARMEKRRKG